MGDTDRTADLASAQPNTVADEAFTVARSAEYLNILLSVGDLVACALDPLPSVSTLETPTEENAKESTTGTDSIEKDAEKEKEKKSSMCNSNDAECILLTNKDETKTLDIPVQEETADPRVEMA